MEIEDIARVGFAARRAPQQQRNLPVGLGVLGEVVVEADRVAAAVHEVLAQSCTGVGRQILQRRRLGCCCRHDDRVFHGAVLVEGGDHLGHGRVLLSNGHVDADVAGALLVDDRVEDHRGLSGLTVADDELALAAADRDHGVDGHDAGLHRLFHTLSGHDAGGGALERVVLGRVDRTFAVEGPAERVDHPPHQSRTHGDVQDALCALGLIALLDEVNLAHQDAAHVVVLEVEGEAEDVVRELDELTGHHTIEPIDAGDAVTDRDHGSDLGHVDGGFEPFDLTADDVRNLGGFDLHVLPLFDLDLFAQTFEFTGQRAVKDPRPHLETEPPKELRFL